MATLSNEAIARIFEKMSRVLSLKGKDRFRILAYERAARALRDLDENLADIAAAGRLEEIPGIGKDLAAKIEEALATGRVESIERECRSTPETLLLLFDIRGLGAKTIAILHEGLEVNNADDLKRVLESGALARMPGFGEKKAAALLSALDAWRAGQERLLLGLVLPQVEELVSQIEQLDSVSRAALAGSLRRGRETIGDADLLVTSDDSAAALREISNFPAIDRVLALGPTRATFLIGDFQVDVRAVGEECFGSALQYFTGSKQHNTHLRALARQRGMKINEYGIFRGSKRLGGAEEEEIYKRLGMPLIPPEMREDRGEIEAALQNKLPRLVQLEGLRGDLHAHTTYSDGHSTMAEMIERAEKLGYEYLALTDHSPSERIARGLTPARRREKARELQRINQKRKGTKPHVLLGTEVDILPDGSLDYPDDVLAQLDVVVAAVHANFQQSSRQMTERILRAIAIPYVQILGHPTARLIGTRDPVSFDFERIAAAAAKAGVALEINGSPWRLDLNDTLARAAQQQGCLLAIGSDAHSANQLSGIRFGVLQAKRGWIQPENVVNTWPWTKLERWLRQRRQSDKVRAMPRRTPADHAEFRVAKKARRG
jgi:DNA polymerase (family 10)